MAAVPDMAVKRRHRAAGTVTITRQPGASQCRALRNRATGSSTCSSTSEQTAWVAQPASTRLRLRLADQVADADSRPGHLRAGVLNGRPRSAPVRRAAPPASEREAAANSSPLPLPMSSRRWRHAAPQQVQDQAAAIVLRRIALVGVAEVVPVLVPVVGAAVRNQDLPATDFAPIVTGTCHRRAR